MGRGRYVSDVELPPRMLHVAFSEGEATAEEKRDQIVPPHIAHVGALLDQLALPIAAVARHVRAKVGAGVGPNGLGISGDGDLVVRGSRARRQKHIPY
jgi:hypothetical protein